MGLDRGAAYLRSGLIDNVSPNPGDIKCGWKNKLSLGPKELLILGADPLRGPNGSVTLNKFEWLFGLKLFKELPGMFTGAEVPWSRPSSMNKKYVMRLFNWFLVDVIIAYKCY